VEALSVADQADEKIMSAFVRGRKPATGSKVAEEDGGSR
jgi:hypothetical protein